MRVQPRQLWTEQCGPVAAAFTFLTSNYQDAALPLLASVLVIQAGNKMIDNVRYTHYGGGGAWAQAQVTV